MERAGFWHRALAAGLDLLIGGFFVGVGVFLVVVVLSLLEVPGSLEDYVLGIAVTLLPLVYTSTEVWLAATPGKLILGLRIAAAAGVPAGKWMLALRWSAKYFGWFAALIQAITLHPWPHALSGWANLVVVVGCLQALDEHRRAWHDEWAGTAVLRRAPGVSRAPSVPPPLPMQTA